MPISNKVSLNFTQAQQDEMMAQVEALRSTLGWTTSLSVEERRTHLKAGDATEAFLLKSLQLGQQCPDIVPRTVNLEEMAKDVEVRPFLMDLRSQLTTVLQRVDDTLLVCGGEAFEAGLQIYKGARSFGQGMGIDDQIEELSRRFEKVKSTSTPA